MSLRKGLWLFLNRAKHIELWNLEVTYRLYSNLILSEKQFNESCLKKLFHLQLSLYC